MAASSQEQPLSLPERPRVIYAGQEKDFTLWDRHKDTLRLLYLTQNLALKKVKHRMEVEYGFPVLALNDYETVLRDHFQFRKNVRGSDWASIGHRIEKRKFAGKASNVYLCGQLIPPHKTKKEINRHGLKGVSKPQGRHALSPLLPKNITIRTPSPQPLPYTATPTVHPCDMVSVAFFETTGGVVVAQPGPCPALGVSKLIDRNVRLELLNTIRLQSPFTRFLVDFRNLFMPNETSEKQFSVAYGSRQSPQPDLPSLGAGAKPGSHFQTSSTSTAKPYEVMSHGNTSSRDCRNSGSLASLPHPVSISEAFTPDLLLQACFVLSNDLDMQGLTTRRLLDWVGISAELTTLKSFFAIRSYTVAAVWETLLQSSSDLKHQRAFEVLLEICFLINRPEWVTRRPGSILSTAVEFREVRTVKRLLSSGISPNHVEISGFDHHTPLAIAAETFQPNMIKILIENGADVNLQSIQLEGGSLEKIIDTPLVSMIRQISLPEKLNSSWSADIMSCIRLLLDAGADVDVESYDVPSFRAKYDHSDEESLSDPQEQTRSLMASLGWDYTPSWLTDIAWWELGADHEIVQTLLKNSMRARHCITVPAIIAQARAGLANLEAYVQSRRFPSKTHERIGLLEIAISKAAELGCLEAVTCLLRFGVDPNVGTLDNQYYWDPAARALDQRHYHVLQTLRENGADISLHEIIEQELSRHDFNELLLVEISDADILADGGQLVLAFLKHADQENFQSCAQMCDLLWSKGAPIDIRGDYGRDALHFAIFQDCCLDMCKYLVGRGYKVHCRPSHATETKVPSTMLRDAITGDSQDMEQLVEFLLANGASINSPNQDESLLEAVCGQCRIGPEGLSSLTDPFSLNRQSQLRIFERLLDLGATVDPSPGRGCRWDPTENSVLVSLIDSKVDDDLIFRIIEASKDVDQQGTPLMAAFKNERHAVVERLLSRGAKVNHLPVPGAISVLQAACVSSCSEAMIERLIDLGAEVNNPSGSKPNDMKPLQMAAAHGRINVVCLLIKYGAEINAIFRSGASPTRGYRTALDLAAANGRLDMVQLLRDAGGRSANPGATGVEGAIGQAEQRYYHSVADFLRGRH